MASTAESTVAGGNDNDVDIWTSPLDVAQNVDSFRSTELQIKKDNIDDLGLDGPKRLFGGLRCRGVEPESDRGFTAGFSN
ncbi:MAG TPA: hypothetical protein VHQ22_22860 [Terriglobales bacterium]|jgi:hypothetical protein|nr:hypothetical protein [Terriglobales bacterium]